MPGLSSHTPCWAPLASVATPIDCAAAPLDTSCTSTKSSPRQARPTVGFRGSPAAVRFPLDQSDLYERYSKQWDRSYDSASTWTDGSADDATTCCCTEDESDEDHRDNYDYEGSVRFHEPVLREMISSWSGQPAIKGRSECEQCSKAGVVGCSTFTKKSRS